MLAETVAKTLIASSDSLSLSSSSSLTSMPSLTSVGISLKMTRGFDQVSNSLIASYPSSMACTAGKLWETVFQTIPDTATTVPPLLLPLAGDKKCTATRLWKVNLTATAMPSFSENC